MPWRGSLAPVLPAALGARFQLRKVALRETAGGPFGRSRHLVPAGAERVLVDLSGFSLDACRRLVARLEEHDGGDLPPLVLLVSSEQEPLALEAVRAGADDYLFADSATPRDVERALASAAARRAPIAALRRLKDELRRSYDQLETVLENLLEACGIYEAVRDESGAIRDFKVRYVNEAAVRANRIPREKQVGSRLLEILPAHARTDLFETYCRVVETGEPVRLESFDYDDPDGVEHVAGVYDIGAFKFGDGFAVTWREVGRPVGGARS